MADDTATADSAQSAHGKEWNAAVYHRISRPQQAWGATVLERLPLRGDETVIDAGCGSGQLTAGLLERLPRGHVIALDRSRNMLDEARAYLESRFGDRVTYIQADLGALEPAAIPIQADAIFSTATFHWVHDHDRLFASLAACLKPGGRLVAQCGGGENIATILGRAHARMTEEPFAPYFAGFRVPTYFATVEETEERLRASGFTGIQVWLNEQPTVLEDEPTYREFLTNVIFHPYLGWLPDPALKAAFIEGLVAQGREDSPPFLLDYWRLNIIARRAG